MKLVFLLVALHLAQDDLPLRVHEHGAQGEPPGDLGREIDLVADPVLAGDELEGWVDEVGADPEDAGFQRAKWLVRTGQANGWEQRSNRRP